MKRIFICAVFLIVSGCASIQTPEDTKIVVSSLLNEIQIAINVINKKTKGTSLPPFKSAELKLSTKAGKTSSGDATLILSAKGEKTTTKSNVITLELVPNDSVAKSLDRSKGREIAEYVIAAVKAIDNGNFLKLKKLTVEAGLEVVSKSGVGIEIEIVGISVGGGVKSSSNNGHSLKLVFG